MYWPSGENTKCNKNKCFDNANNVWPMVHTYVEKGQKLNRSSNKDTYNWHWHWHLLYKVYSLVFALFYRVLTGTQNPFISPYCQESFGVFVGKVSLLILYSACCHVRTDFSIRWFVVFVLLPKINQHKLLTTLNCLLFWHDKTTPRNYLIFTKLLIKQCDGAE